MVVLLLIAAVHGSFGFALLHMACRSLPDLRVYLLGPRQRRGKIKLVCADFLSWYFLCVNCSQSRVSNIACGEQSNLSMFTLAEGLTQTLICGLLIDSLLDRILLP